MIARVWRSLLEPARPIEDVAEALRRRLLLGLLLSVLVLGCVGAVVYELTSVALPFAPRAALGLQALGLLLFFGAYLLARLGTDRIARLVALGVPLPLILMVIFWSPEGSQPGAFVLHLLLPIVLGTALLTVRQAALFTVAVIGLGALLPAVAPGLAYTPDQLNYLAYLTFLGGIVLVIARHRDRLEQARQQQLREREEQYRLLAENITDMVFVQNVELDPVYVSPSAEGLFGYTAAEMMKLRMADVMTPASLARVMSTYQCLLERAQHADVQVPLMQYEYVRKDGSVFTGELRVKFLRDAAGKPVGSQGVLRDISERVALEEQLRQSERLRVIGQLAGGVAHDFNNQLAGIRGSAELLLHRMGSSGGSERELLQGIVKAADRSAQLTRQLLAFARRASAQMIPTDLGELVRDVVSMLEHSISKRIRLAEKVHDARPMVLADPAQLHSAVLNVALNARDAMPDGGELEFDIRRLELGSERGAQLGYEVEPGTYLALSVRDTGRGMAPDTRERMFEPFFTTKGPGEGSGMGLAIVDGTIRVHGGAIEVETAPGRGTRVTLFLRAVDAAMTDAPGAGTRPRTQGTVLVVDDEQIVRNSTAGLLEALGYQVLKSSGGLDALERYRANAASIDVVLLDVVMPDLGGREVLREILCIRPDARVVMVSGYSANPEEGIDAGARAFLAKPFSMEQVAAAIGKARV